MQEQEREKGEKGIDHTYVLIAGVSELTAAGVAVVIGALAGGGLPRLWTNVTSAASSA